MNTHIQRKMLLKPVFFVSWYSVEISAGGLTRDVERGDSKVLLGMYTCSSTPSLLSLLRDQAYQVSNLIPCSLALSLASCIYVYVQLLILRRGENSQHCGRSPSLHY